MKKTWLVILGLIVGFLLAQVEGLSPMLRMTNSVCIWLRMIMAPIVVLCIIFAAIAYVVGPVFGAEMKGRATSWAASLIVGAIIGIIIWFVAKPIIVTLAPEMGGLPEEALADFCSEAFEAWLA